MKWASSGFNVAISDCGEYEVRKSTDPIRGEFYNAWHLPTGKHIAADHKKAVVIAACVAHKARLAAMAEAA